MRTIGWNVLVLSFVYFASAQRSKICSAPPQYPHAALVKKYTSRLYFGNGEKVYYSCAEDFTPTRGIRVVQCLDGKWTKLTLKCEKKSCGNAGYLPNGNFEYEGNTYIGEKVYAVCNEGYTLKGPNFMICKKSGWTGEFPTCEEGEVTCPIPAVGNSLNSSSGGSVYRVGDGVNFTCSHGFRLSGSPQIACGPNGQWQPELPRCLPVPTQLPDKEGKCGAPAAVANSNLADKYLTMQSFASGQRVSYVCDLGYVQAGGSRYRSCVGGKWTPLRLRCERKLCGSAGEILNGEYVYTGVEFGDVATAVCDEGYQLVGRGTRRCMNKGWDGREPVCEAVECEEPPQVANAVMNGNQESYTYRSVVAYHCKVGSLNGSKDIWCTADGTWSAPPPTCEEITCPSPNVPNAFWVAPQSGSYQYRNTISIECNQGFKLTGPHIVNCGSDGRWSPGLPRCTPIPRRAQWRN